MGQKINPHGLRVGVILDWDSRWYVSNKDFGDTIVEDYKIRVYLKKKLKEAGVPKIEIERTNSGTIIRIRLHCAKPGLVIGKGGQEVDKIKAEIEKITKKSVSLDIVEVKNIDANAQLVAEKIAKDLEERVSFRRATKQAINRSMKAGAKGIKTMVSGRLGGAEIARSETYKEGTIPLQTIRADIDYGFAEADTQYGKIGVKVWIYRGEVLKGEKGAKLPDVPRQDRRGGRNDRRPRQGGQGQGAGGGYRGGQGGQGGGYRGNQGQGGYRSGQGQGGQGTQGGYRGNQGNQGGQGGYRANQGGQGGQGFQGSQGGQGQNAQDRPRRSRPENSAPQTQRTPKPVAQVEKIVDNNSDNKGGNE